MIRLDHAIVCIARRPLCAPVSLALEPGQIGALVGPNGVGKTTLLRALMGQHPYAGSITLNGQDVRGLAAKDWPRTAVWVPQRADVAWNPNAKTVATLGFERLLGADDLETRCTIAFEALGITAKTRQALGTLSGGERQRVMLARALISPAPFIVLDEPCAALDDAAIARLHTALRAECDAGRTVLMTLHRAHDMPDIDHITTLTDAG
jgi:iron complex transport system ATP-binding protein